jgi:hypothetical protein
VLSTFLDFKSNIRVILEVLREPDSGEMTPPQLLHNDIPLNHDLTDVDWVVPSDLIVRNALILTALAIGVEIFFIDFILEGNSLLCLSTLLVVFLEILFL